VRIFLIAVVIGVILGAGFAYLGATRVFDCIGRYNVSKVCPASHVLIALAWGTPVGAAAGLVGGWLLARRRAT
jgi:hypothetical protein